MNAPFTDDGRANRTSARRHLRMMDAARRAILEAEWAEGERAADYISEPISEEIKARAAREWDCL